MHEHRFLCLEMPSVVSGEVTPGMRLMLNDEESHHLARVLRMKEGERVVLFDGCGGEARAQIVDVDGPAVQVEVIECHMADPAGPVIHLFVPWLKETPRLDWLIEKAAELGVLGVTVWGAPKEIDKRLERWGRLAVAAAKQSGQARLMEVGHSADSVMGAQSMSVSILLSEKSGAIPIRDALAGHTPLKNVALLIGPEQGFTEEEERDLESRGWKRASLGPMRLRVETAAIAAVAAVRALAPNQ